MSAIMSVAIIANARASVDPLLRQAVLRLRKSGHRIQVLLPWEQGDGQRLCTQAIAAGARIVIAAGGDGTLNEVVNGVMTARTHGRVSVGVVPYGTGNDFATTCGVVSKDPLAALRAILELAPQRIDLGKTNGRYFINAATGGIPATVTTRARGRLKDAVGRLAYVFTGLRNLAHLEGSPAVVTWNEGRWTGRLLGIAIGNGRQTGGGVRFAPTAYMDDGVLDVVIVPEQPVNKLLTVARDITQAERQKNMRNAVAFKTSRLLIRVPNGLQFNLDGEAMEADELSVDVVPGALMIRVPKPPLRSKGLHDSMER